MSARTLTSIALLLALSCARPAAAEEIVNVEALFNAGVNMGWLEASFETGLFPGDRPGYVAGCTGSFEAGFDVAPGWGTFVLSQREASFRWMHMQQKVRNVASRSRNPLMRNALAIMQAGSYLGYAHIEAQKGTCPGCVQSSMERAGLALRSTRVPALVTLGNDLVNTARAMRVRSVAELQGYTGYLVGAITSVQNSI